MRAAERVAVMAAFTAVAAWAGPAFAHEVPVAVLVPDGRDGFRDGFDLAVDESPDVSHAPGAQAGDHLGGIDVELTYVRADEQANAARAAGRAQVVVVNAGGQSTDVLRAARDFKRAFVVSAGAQLAAQPGWVVLVDAPPQNARREAFEARFRGAYGRRATAAAARGYDAAKVLDQAVGSIGEGIDAAGANAFVPDTTDLVGSTLAAATPSPTGGATALERGGANPAGRQLAFVGLTAGVVAAATWRLVRRPPSRGRS